ncbi:hypothetical protein MRB53_034626 [Persea americana]|uniref:Uncharacterized protein n=1 Tax=Persea americana TaxID=3435 RepID=A0ACC2K2K4_PERAE|nr:hypothetical protein MRB53_034626 [Persea americana]
MERVVGDGKGVYLVQGEMGAAWGCVRMQGGDRGRGIPIPGVWRGSGGGGTVRMKKVLQRVAGHARGDAVTMLSREIELLRR